MSIRVTCQCGRAFAAAPRLAGRRVECPSCGASMNVPFGPESEPPAGYAPDSRQPIIIACECGKRFQADRRLAGRTLKCPACGRPIRVAPRQADATAKNVGLALASDVEFWNEALTSTSPATRPANLLASSSSLLRTTLPRPTTRRTKGHHRLLPVYIGCGTIAALLLVGFILLSYYTAEAFMRGYNRAQSQHERLYAERDQWRTFRSEIGGYSISLPGAVGEENEFPQCDDRITEATALASDNTLLQVSVFDMPPAMAAAPPDQVLHELCDKELSQANVTANKVRISLDGYPGMEIAYEGPSKTGIMATFRVRYYFVEHRLYVLRASRTNEHPPQGDAVRFLNSFRLLGTSESPVLNRQLPPKTAL